MSQTVGHNPVGKREQLKSKLQNLIKAVQRIPLKFTPIFAPLLDVPKSEWVCMAKIGVSFDNALTLPAPAWNSTKIFYFPIKSIHFCALVNLKVYYLNMIPDVFYKKNR